MRLGERSRPLRRSCAAVLLLGVALTACGESTSTDEGAGDDPQAPSEVVSDDATGTPDENCAAVISDDVVARLGWETPGEAVTSVGRCERTGSGDTVTVAADATVRPDGGADAVQAAYDDACAALPTDGPGVAERDPDWLDGASACVVGPADDATAGFFEFYTVSGSGWLVHGQVAQSTDAPADDVRAAIALLVTQSEAADWG